MLKTKQRNRMQIKDLQTDFEVINPIESKKVLGGDWYNGWDSWYYDQDGVHFNSGGNDDWNSDPYGNYNDPGTWGDNYGSAGGGGDGGVPTIEDYPGEELTLAEQQWILAHSLYLPSMIHNKNLAEEYGKNQHNGVYDALRHALWSALDAADMGAQNAYDFHTLHETENWHPVESPSDLINNGWGYNWTLQNGDPENNMNQFIIDFNHAAQNGSISIIP